MTRAAAAPEAGQPVFPPEAPAGEPLARLYGEPLEAVPADLYIPPQALRVLLEAFEGLFDLLWYLIRKNRLDVKNLPVAEITRQYLAYLEAMRALDLNLAADYLAMAATLIAIKARLLLPPPHSSAGEETEEDPRARLVARLERYEQFRQLARAIDALPRAGRDFLWHASVAESGGPVDEPIARWPAPTVRQLAQAWWEVLVRHHERRPHTVTEPPLSLPEVTAELLARLAQAEQPLALPELLPPAADRCYLVTAFFALLELTRLGQVELEQAEPLGPIWVAPAGTSAGPAVAVAVDPQQPCWEPA